MEKNIDYIARHPKWFAYTRFMRRWDFAYVLLSVAIFIVSFYAVKNIQVRSDFKEMLPERYQSVIEYNKLEKRMRSTGSLVFLLGDASWPAMKQFIEDFSAKAKVELSEEVDTIEYNSKKIGDFYDKNKFLFADLPDLKEVYERLDRQIAYEKLSRTGLYVNFEDQPPKFDISDIEKKYKSKSGNYLDYKEGYFTTPDATLAAVVLKPKAGAANVEFASKLIDKTLKLANSMNPEKYDPNLKFTVGGRYQKMVAEYHALIGDILMTTILCFVMVGGLVFLYYRRIKICLSVLLAAAQGVLLALAIGYIAIGYLTSQTAFLGSIIAGNGINYSIIMLARYLEERRINGLPVTESISIAMSQTWLSTLVISLATAASFSVLVLTNVKGFSQFGFLGGIGMFLCWCSTYFFMPAWFSLFEKIWETKVPKATKQKQAWIFRKVAEVVDTRYVTLLKATGVISILAIILTAWYLPNSIEYNFENMRFKPAKQAGTDWEIKARDRFNEIFTMSTTPAVILTDSMEEADEVCKVIRERVKAPGMDVLMDECKTVNSFVPAEQPEKLAVLADMRELLSQSSLEFLTEDQKEEVDKFKETLDLKELTLDDIPKTIVNTFQEADGSVGKLAYVYPKPTTNLWNGKELIRFANLIREVDLPNGKKIYSSGEQVIFADLFRVVVKEGPVATSLSLLAVIVFILLTFKFSKTSLSIIVCLFIGVIWLLASLAFMDVKFNFLNFIALPISFAIGIDYAINIFQRYKFDGFGSIPNILKNTGGAVILCSCTTIIGYSVLLTSRSMGLVSFGKVALMGEIMSLSAGILALPSYIIWKERKKTGLMDSVVEPICGDKQRC